MVRHDPISGMPSGTYTVRPAIGPDGDLVMSEWPARDFDVEPEDPLPGLEDVGDDVAIPRFRPRGAGVIA